MSRTPLVLLLALTLASPAASAPRVSDPAAGACTARAAPEQPERTEGRNAGSEKRFAVFLALLVVFLIGFGTAAALYFNDAFFPAEDPLSGTLLSFATLGIGFAVLEDATPAECTADVAGTPAVTFGTRWPAI